MVRVMKRMSMSCWKITKFRLFVCEVRSCYNRYFSRWLCARKMKVKWNFQIAKTAEQAPLRQVLPWRCSPTMSWRNSQELELSWVDALSPAFGTHGMGSSCVKSKSTKQNHVLSVRALFAALVRSWCRVVSLNAPHLSRTDTVRSLFSLAIISPQLELLQLWGETFSFWNTLGTTW